MASIKIKKLPIPWDKQQYIAHCKELEGVKKILPPIPDGMELYNRFTMNLKEYEVVIELEGYKIIRRKL